ncbi:MAG: hypothetical protein JWO03_3866 [Bacteroidetes bacterium]|nr:hypothetical protein [Bacteroidota bacterium]
MARLISGIRATIQAALAANNNLTYVDSGGVTRNITTNTSRRAMWLNWSDVVATCQAILEQLMDVYQSNIEAQVAKAASASQLWIQAKMFEFQYDGTLLPQIVQLIDTVPQYPVVDATKRIITACAVSVDQANNVNIKIAKGNPFVKLATDEAAAAQAYINIIGDAGITYNVISLDPDKLFIRANIYYQGQYANIIKTNVITALVNFLQNLSKTNFDGSLKMSDLEGVIRGVTGVDDVEMVDVTARPNAISFGSGTQLIQNKNLLNRLYLSKAGYIIQETTSGQTFADTLNFI